MSQDERPSNPADHRSSGRIRAFLRGEIIHSNGNSRTECTVRDISDGGARVEAPASVTLPEFFELFIPLKNIRHRARMTWRAGNEIGVAFVIEAARPTPETAAAEAQLAHQDREVRGRLQELEAETTRLRAQLAQMQSIIETLVKERGAA